MENKDGIFISSHHILKKLSKYRFKDNYTIISTTHFFCRTGCHPAGKGLDGGCEIFAVLSLHFLDIFRSLSSLRSFASHI